MSFSEASLSEKFRELNSTQHSVQTLSLWLIHHRRHSKTIVNTWLRELTSTNKSERKLTFMYLANDILQNSRKKGHEYMKDFATVLDQAILNTCKHSDEKIRFTIERILNIWKDRRIYPDDTLERFRNIIRTQTESTTSPQNSTSSPAKQKLAPDEDKSSNETIKKRKSNPSPQESNAASSKAETPLKSGKISLREEVLKEMAQNGSNVQIPESSELVNMLQELEKSASSDAIVRQKIAELPSKVTDLAELKKIKDKQEALELAKIVNDAMVLLENYNSRLQQELVSRKRTAVLLAGYLKQHQQDIDTDQRQIDEWQKKFRQVLNVRKELETHLKSLPDLASIEQAAERIPLPSAGDLFN